MMFLGALAEQWGFIPDMLDEADCLPARKQIDERYPGGWRDAPSGVMFDPHNLTLTYPGDPPFPLIGMMLFRDERLLLFKGSFVVILQRDDTWRCARLD
jgi:hypothetical protein